MAEIWIEVMAQMQTSFRVADVHVTDMSLVVALRDGREFAAPLAWFPKLQSASKDDRAHWEISAAGYGIHWPQIDEDLSVEGLMRSDAEMA